LDYFASSKAIEPAAILKQCIAKAIIEPIGDYTAGRTAERWKVYGK